MEPIRSLVIGSGLAGLYFALRAADDGRVVIVTKAAPDDGSTAIAQGGVAAVLSQDDSLDSHVADTLTVGAGLCREDIVRMTISDGARHIRELIELGVDFARGESGELDLGREGGHSERRVAHVADLTGRAIHDALMARVASHPNVTIWTDAVAVDLLTAGRPAIGGPCFGAYVLHRRSGAIVPVVADHVVLATGGVGQAYRYTSNSAVSTGDGIAMAYRAGARVANMEFLQFHPTLLAHPFAKGFLISEALRGEGGELRLSDGTPFMRTEHELGSLAPRDVVARAIDRHLTRTGESSVFLDMTHLDPIEVVERFPGIHARCMQLGIDMRHQWIPVVPGAHYSCGGVDVDDSGRSTVPNLLAIGETACTGLHGACRLASNSLLEALVFADRAAVAARSLEPVRPEKADPWEPGNAVASDEAVVIRHNWEEIRSLMWSYVGIVRSDKRLERARRRIELIRDEIRQYYWDSLVTPELIELRNMALVAHLIVESASRRKESRGLHFNIDHPDALPDPVDTVFGRADGPLAG